MILLSGCVDKSTQGEKTLICEYGSDDYIYIYDEVNDRDINEKMTLDIKFTYHAKDDFIYKMKTIHTIDRQKHDPILKYFDNDYRDLYRQLHSSISTNDPKSITRNEEIDDASITFITETEYFRKDGLLHQVNPYNELSLAAQFANGGIFKDPDVCELSE